MHVPIELSSRIKGGIDTGEEIATKGGGDVVVGYMVECEGEGYFVKM